MVWGTFQSLLKSPSPVGPALGQEEVGVLCTWSVDGDLLPVLGWSVPPRGSRSPRACPHPRAFATPNPCPVTVPASAHQQDCRSLFIVSFEDAAVHPFRRDADLVFLV